MTGWTNLCLPYSKGFMNFACPDPSKRMFDFWNFLACSKFNQFCMNFSVLKMNMSNMEISQIQKKTYRWIPVFFIVFYSLLQHCQQPDGVQYRSRRSRLYHWKGERTLFRSTATRKKIFSGNYFSAQFRHFLSHTKGSKCRLSGLKWPILMPW